MYDVPRGLAETVKALPGERAEDFRRAFVAHAEKMRHSEEGIVLDFIATLHVAKAPWGPVEAVRGPVYSEPRHR